MERLMVGDAAKGTGEMGGKGRGFVVKEGTVCKVCHKRLGGSVMVWVPPGVGVGGIEGEKGNKEGMLVHYGCQGGRRSLGRGGF